MSDVALSPPALMRKPFMRTATAIVWIVSLTALMLIALHVINAGFVRRDIEALQAGEAWRTGGWLSQVVLSLVALVPNLDLQQSRCWARCDSSRPRRTAGRSWAAP